MKFQPLKPWVLGNEIINPNNFYRNLKPCFEMGAFVLLDTATDLYLANTIDTGNLFDSWNKNAEYIEQACKIANVSKDNCYDLDKELKRLILDKIGEPPECCYNIYFITIYNDTDEQLVYIGKTDSKKSRFSNGHLAALKLNNPKYNMFNKRIYFGTIVFISEEKHYIPLEFITPYCKAKKLLDEFEAVLISHFNPELNVKCEQMGEMCDLFVHIQNSCNESDFLNNYFVYSR